MTAAEAGREAAPPPLGPVQMLVLGFTEDSFKGAILPELRRLRDVDLVRLLDLLVVRKNDVGEIDIHHVSELDEDDAREFRGLIGALLGFGAGGEEMSHAEVAGAAELDESGAFDEASVWYVADVIPPGTAAAIALIEHRWAIPLRDRIVEAGGFALADEWIHPADLIAVGKALGTRAAGSVRA
jgi:hypothetical protein